MSRALVFPAYPFAIPFCSWFFSLHFSCSFSALGLPILMFLFPFSLLLFFFWQWNPWFSSLVVTHHPIIYMMLFVVWLSAFVILIFFVTCCFCFCVFVCTFPVHDAMWHSSGTPGGKSSLMYGSEQNSTPLWPCTCGRLGLSLDDTCIAAPSKARFVSMFIFSVCIYSLLFFSKLSEVTQND